MSGAPARRALRLALLALALSPWAPATAGAAGLWTTYIHMGGVNSILAPGDTVLLATDGAGIVRYLRGEDRFESVTRTPGGLASNTITDIAYDRTGRLWAATAGKGVSHLSADGRDWGLINAFDGVPSDTVTVLRAEGDTLWIGTTRGIALWDGREVAGSIPDIGSPSPFLSNYVTGLAVMGDSLWVSTQNGIYLGRLSQSLGAWAAVDSGLGTTNIARLASDGTDLVALGANGVLYHLNRYIGAWGAVSTASRPKNLRDAYGRLYVATLDSLCVWTGSGWAAIPGGTHADPSSGLAVGADPTGHIFASRFGILYEQTSPAWIKRTPPGPIGNDVNNVGSDGTSTWIAFTASGVSRLDGGAWTNWLPGCCGPGQDSTFLNPIYTYTLFMDGRGHVWTSHWDTGIERIDTTVDPLYFLHAYSTWGVDKTDTLSRHSDGWSAAADSEGYVYIGGDTPDLGGLEPMGIDVYDPAGNWLINWKTSNANLGANQVRAIAYDRLNQVIWAGFANRGVSYADWWSIDSDGDQSNGNDHLTLPQFTPVSSLLSRNVYGIAAFGDSIWVLTASDLVRLKGSTRSVQSTYDILAQPALGAVHPLAIARDGSVWTGSVEGVRHIYRSGNALVHDDFTVDNSPLADNEVRAIAVDPRTGVLWFGTASGTNRFDPAYVPPAPPPLPALHVRVFPNPALLNAMGIRLLISGNTAAYDGEIVDVSGRVVKRFTAAADGGVVWDGRDRDGHLVRSGVYFVHARGGGHEATARVVVLR